MKQYECANEDKLDEVIYTVRKLLSYGLWFMKHDILCYTSYGLCKGETGSGLRLLNVGLETSGQNKID